MKKDVEVFIVVVCDQEPNKILDSKLLASVRNSIAKIEGVIETYLSPNTADIGALASWEEEKIPVMVEEISNIHGVKSIETKILSAVE